MGTSDNGNLKAFIPIWITQVLSTLATSMSSFALAAWVYEQTRSASAMALIQAAFITPFLIMSFFAGPLIDRLNRKLMMAVSDLVAVVGTVGVLAVFLSGSPALWMIIASSALNGIGNAFQWPAFSAVLGSMVPKKQLGRVNGLVGLIDAGPQILAPVLAGLLLPLIQIKGILILDLATFALAAAAILGARIPQPPVSEEGKKLIGKGIISQAAFGFSYIFKRKSLMQLQLLFLFANLFSGMGFTLMQPLVLSRSSMDMMALGSVRSAWALGGFLGGLIMSVWGGFKKRSWGVYLGWMANALFGMVLLGVSNSITLTVILAGLGAIAGPIVNASNQAIWQQKVPPDLQGRVFSARRLIAWLTLPIAPLIAGALADFGFEPLLATSSTPFARLVSPLFGSGPGTGTAFLLSLTGLAVMASVSLFWCLPSLRNAEILLPDPTIESGREAANDPAAASEAKPAEADAVDSEGPK